MIYIWQIKGTQPLMQNNPANTMDKNGSDLSTRKKYNNEEEAEKRLYLNDEGNFTHPTSAFIKSILYAAKNRKIGKNSAVSIASAAVMPVEEFVVLTDEKNLPLKNYEIDIRRVVVQRQGVLRARPKYDKWYCKVPLEIDNDMLSLENLNELFVLAGKICGIGEHRPERKGFYGKYEIKLIK